MNVVLLNATLVTYQMNTLITDGNTVYSHFDEINIGKYNTNAYAMGPKGRIFFHTRKENITIYQNQLTTVEMELDIWPTYDWMTLKLINASGDYNTKTKYKVKVEVDLDDYYLRYEVDCSYQGNKNLSCKNGRIPMLEESVMAFTIKDDFGNEFFSYVETSVYDALNSVNDTMVFDLTPIN